MPGGRFRRLERFSEDSLKYITMDSDKITGSGGVLMRKIKIAAFAAAVITALGVFYLLSNLNKPAEAERTSVVVAVVDIPENVTITADMVTVTAVPTEAVLPHAVTDVSMVVGSVLKADVFAGEQILMGRLVRVGEISNGTLAYLVSPGMRAITIAVDETGGLAGMIKPGNRVDIIAQYQVEMQVYRAGGGTETKMIPVAKLLLQNIEVLTVDRVMSKDGKPEGESYTTVTLEVTPEQAVQLSYSENTGLLRAILRSPLDDDEVDFWKITIEDVISD